MAKAIVKHPELVNVSTTRTDHTVALELNVAHVDRGKVIGKQGRTLKAKRTILTAASTHSKNAQSSE